MESKNLDIKSWAADDRPREKLLKKGKSALSNAELIGILIASGTQRLTAIDVAKLILSQVDNDLNKLAKLTPKDLMKIKGVGEAKALSIIAALELGRRRNNEDSELSPQIKSSNHIFQLMKPQLLDLSHEEFWVIHLNRANRVIHKQQVSTGGVSGTIADPKIIFKCALENSASSIVLVHNHPSGNLNPSTADNLLTTKIKEAGKFLEITLLDHIIFTNSGYFSWADENKL